jgi:xanthine dehydrogenase YagR molybdenum-binding subunit
MNSAIIGQPITRIDGRKKVTGAAPYAVEHAIPNLAYGVGVASRIGSGRITRIDPFSAEKMPGVLAVLHHANAPRLHHPAGQFEESSRPGESRPPLADDRVYYYGQFVALVIAETFEQAQEAAWHVHVDYASAPPQVGLGQAPDKNGAPAAQYARGDMEAAYRQAEVKLEATYDIPVETHNPMEMHGTIAVWDHDKLTLYETTQGVVNHHHVASEVLGVPLESIDVISPFVGSGFGSKLFPWPHSWLAAIAARQVERPVNVVVPRTLMFTTTGHRPRSRQRVRLGAGRDGKLVAISNKIRQHTSMVDDYLEDCVEPTAMLYSCPNVSAVQHLVPLNVGTPTPMRGPGRTPALFALESAMDELAELLDMDPLEIRLRNHAERDESKDLPWSSKHLREAYQAGADRFGWSKRDPRIGSMRKGGEVLGWGMASCTWPGRVRDPGHRHRYVHRLRAGGRGPDGNSGGPRAGSVGRQRASAGTYIRRIGGNRNGSSGHRPGDTEGV